jgi:hypothetical protein
MRAAASVLAILAALDTATLARADDRPDIELRWSAPSGCPDEASVRGAIERFASHPVASPSGQRVQVAVDVASSSVGAWTVRIAITNPGDTVARERRIEGATCAEVTDAAALAIAMAIVAPRPSPSPAAEVPASQPPRAPEPPRDAPKAPTVRRPEQRGGVRVLAGADFASLPAPTFGAEIAGSWLFGANRLEAFGSAWLPVQASSTMLATAGAHLSLFAGGARYCRMFLERALDVGACGGLEAGAIRGMSYGVTRPAPGVGGWVAPSVGLLGQWAFSRPFSLELRLDGLVPVLRESFQIGAVGEIYRPPPVSGRALLGVEAHFP